MIFQVLLNIQCIYRRFAGHPSAHRLSPIETDLVVQRQRQLAVEIGENLCTEKKFVNIMII